MEKIPKKWMIYAECSITQYLFSGCPIERKAQGIIYFENEIEKPEIKFSHILLLKKNVADSFKTQPSSVTIIFCMVIENDG